MDAQDGLKSSLVRAVATAVEGVVPLLLVEESDLFTTHSYDYGGGHDVYITFKCPQCKCKTDVTGVPRHVTDKLGDDPDKRSSSAR